MASFTSSGWTSSSDAEVAAELIQVKGVGQWTVDMYLIFHLGRPM